MWTHKEYSPWSTLSISSICSYWGWRIYIFLAMQDARCTVKKWESPWPGSPVYFYILVALSVMKIIGQIEGEESNMQVTILSRPTVSSHPWRRVHQMSHRRQTVQRLRLIILRNSLHHCAHTHSSTVMRWQYVDGQFIITGVIHKWIVVMRRHLRIDAHPWQTTLHRGREVRMIELSQRLFHVDSCSCPIGLACDIGESMQ